MARNKDKAYRDGKRRLQKLKYRAKADARKSSHTAPNPLSLLGQSLFNHIEECHLDSLMIYETNPGHWYADLVFKKLPLGLPDSLGTPEHRPKSRREDALTEGYTLLVAVFAAIAEKHRAGHDTRPANYRVFELYDISFQIPADAVETCNTTLTGNPAFHAYSLSDARAYLESAIMDISSGEPFCSAAFDAASEAQRVKLMAAMTTMLIFGVFRYPERQTEAS